MAFKKKTESLILESSVRVAGPTQVHFVDLQVVVQNYLTFYLFDFLGQFRH